MGVSSSAARCGVPTWPGAPSPDRGISLPWGAVPGSHGPRLIPGTLLPSSGDWRRELKALFCPSPPAGSGSGCPAAPAHVLATTRSDPISPEASVLGKPSSCASSSPENRPSLPAQSSEVFLSSVQPHCLQPCPPCLPPALHSCPRTDRVLLKRAYHLPATPSLGLRVPLHTALMATKVGPAGGISTRREPQLPTTPTLQPLTFWLGVGRDNALEQHLCPHSHCRVLDGDLKYRGFQGVFTR